MDNDESYLIIGIFGKCSRSERKRGGGGWGSGMSEWC